MRFPEHRARTARPSFDGPSGERSANSDRGGSEPPSRNRTCGRPCAGVPKAARPRAPRGRHAGRARWRATARGASRDTARGERPPVGADDRGQVRAACLAAHRPELVGPPAHVGGGHPIDALAAQVAARVEGRGPGTPHADPATAVAPVDGALEEDRARRRARLHVDHPSPAARPDEGVGGPLRHPSDVCRPRGAPRGRDGRRLKGAAPPASIRCAIYGRKSVEERIATNFGSIEAQREACEAYVKSQTSLAWTALPQRYDDEGFTGANVARPALARLLADIEAGVVDAVVVYKIDRLSRSIADFVRLMETFDRKGVSFVSVTQQFNTSTSVGRLTLNLLTVFAQFERETISERTRDKMRAARRRGKFTGGGLLLGYDRAPEGRRLVVNEAEADRVRAIFDLYLELRSLTAVALDVKARGWTTKSWETKQGRTVVARPVNRIYLAQLLKNPAYVGKVRIDGEVFPAEHAAIVEETVFDAAQRLLAENARTGGGEVRNKHHMLLTGLIHCASCDRPMVPTYCKKRGRLYRYCVCRRTREEGWAACATKSVSATQIESLVVAQIRGVGRDAGVFGATLAAACARAGGAAVDPEDLRRALLLWDHVWAALTLKEQARVMALLVESVVYDGPAGSAALTFRPTGIRALAQESTR